MRNDHGFSLAELMITLGIVSLGSLSVMFFYKELAMSKNRVEYSAELDTLINQVSSAISGDNCVSKLGLKNLSVTGENVPLTYLPSSIRLLKINSIYLSDMTLAKTYNNYNIITSALNINYNSFGSNQSKVIKLAVLHAKKNNLNDVISCSITPIAI
jgi:prepilin-type N-terminal cleavage/methylation domain-containing protein